MNVKFLKWNADITDDRHVSKSSKLSQNN